MVLRKVWFSKRCIDHIWWILSSNWYSILVNGQLSGFFPFNQELRQGNPLSPALFIIAAESLSRSLKQPHATHHHVQYKTTPGSPVISHLGYADDIVIFCNASTFSLWKHISDTKLLHFSGQQVNTSKTYFIAGTRNFDRLSTIKSVTGFTQQFLPL